MRRSSKYIMSPNQNTPRAAATAAAAAFQQHIVDMHRNTVNNTDTVAAPVCKSFVNYRYDDMDETDLPSPPTPTDAPSAAVMDTQPLLGDAQHRQSRVFCCPDTLNVRSLLSSAASSAARPGGAVKVLDRGDRHDGDRQHSDEVGDRTAAPAAATATAHAPAPHHNHPKSHTDGSLPQANGTGTSTSTAAIARPANKLSTLSPVRMVEPAAGADRRRSCRRTSSPSGRRSVQFDDDSAAGADGDGVGDGAALDGGDGELATPSTSDRTQDDLIQFVFTSHGIRVISNKEYVV